MEEKSVAAVESTRGMFQCYWDVLKNYFKFGGRASRYEYWAFAIIDWFIALIIVGIIGLINQNISNILYAAYALLTFIPTLAVSFRRLHDVNKSGWFITAPVLVLVIFAVVDSALEYSGIGLGKIGTIVMGACASGALIFTILVFYWKCKKGSLEANKYGAPVLEVAPRKQAKIMTVLITLYCLLIIIGILLMGAISGYSKAMQKYKMNQTLDQINMLVRNVKLVYENEDSYSSLNNALVNYLGLAAPDMYNENNQLSNVYGGGVAVVGENDVFLIVYGNVPDKGCAALVDAAKSIPEWNVVLASCEDCAGNVCNFNMIVR